MRNSSFIIWLEQKKSAPLVPEGDKLMKIIVQAGRNGITDVELRSRIDLERIIVDGILKGLIQLGLVTASGQSYGERIYRAVDCPAGRLLFNSGM